FPTSLRPFPIVRGRRRPYRHGHDLPPPGPLVDERRLPGGHHPYPLAARARRRGALPGGSGDCDGRRRTYTLPVSPRSARTTSSTLRTLERLMTRSASRLPDILKQNDADILRDWVKEQLATLRPEAMSESSLREQTQRFFGLLRDAVQSGELADITGPAWTGVREMLTDLSQSRATFGYTPSETAMFVLSLKQPLFTRLRQDVGRDAEALADEVWTATQLLDKLALFTTEVYQKGREALISRQQHEMLELSTPVVQLWDNVLALPLIGTLDSERTQVVMENLLHKIVDTGAAIAIIDTT